MRVIVIGNGMVGHKFCERLLARASENVEIVVFGEESLPAYDRVHLSNYFSGRSAYELCLSPVQWYADNKITLYLGDPVVDIDRDKQTVTSFNGVNVQYDFLVFATGSSAFVPQIPGTDKEGVFVYRTIEDLNSIKRHAPSTKSATVIGGGLLGLEAAKAMLDLGIADTHVIEFAPRLMPRQIDHNGSTILQQKLQTLGITVHTNKNTAAVLGNDTIRGLLFSDGSILHTDMLVISAGIKPRDELAKRCGIEIGHRGGIIVNDIMKTSDPSIFAIGECALHNHTIYGLVAPGYEMADVVVTQLTGEKKTFLGFDMSTKLKLIGVDVASFGDPFISGDDCRSVIIEDHFKGIYKRINLSADGKTLLGGILVGNADEYHLLQQMCKK